MSAVSNAIEKVSELVAPKPKTKIAAPIAPGIKTKLAAAEAKLEELNSQLGHYALGSIEGGEAGQRELQAHMRLVDEAERQVRLLTVALDAARQADAQADRARIAAARQAQVNSMKYHLAARDKAASELQIGLKKSVDAFERMLTAGEAAAQSSPTPLGAYFHVNYHRVRLAILAELWRVGHGETNSAGIHMETFPGVRFSDVSMLQVESGNREFLPGQMADDKIWVPLAERMRRESAQIIAEVSGTPLPAPPPVQAVEEIVALADELAQPEHRVIAMSDALANEMVKKPVRTVEAAYHDNGTIPPASVLTPPIEAARIISDDEWGSMLKEARYFRDGVDSVLGRHYQGDGGDFSIPHDRRLAVAKELEALPRKAIPNPEPKLGAEQ